MKCIRCGKKVETGATVRETNNEKTHDYGYIIGVECGCFE
jgi:DNA-directed RNA polymerase subunit RPC12/RpoP